MITLTELECLALWELIDEATGGNARGVFAWDDTDKASDPLILACLKIYREAGKETPDIDV